MQETQVRSLGQADPLEAGMATHSSVLAWRIPMDRGAWWDIPPWSHKRVGHDLRIKEQPQTLCPNPGPLLSVFPALDV